MRVSNCLDYNLMLMITVHDQKVLKISTYMLGQIQLLRFLAGCTSFSLWPPSDVRGASAPTDLLNTDIHCSVEGMKSPIKCKCIRISSPIRSE